MTALVAAFAACGFLFSCWKVGAAYGKGLEARGLAEEAKEVELIRLQVEVRSLRFRLAQWEECEASELEDDRSAWLRKDRPIPDA